MEKPRIGITTGDINGVGLEVILKTLSDERILQICTPIIYGSTKVVSYHKNIVAADFNFFSARSIENIHTDKVNVVNCWQENVNITLGKVTELGGKYAIRSLEAALADLQKGQIHAVVTSPIHKKAMNEAGFGFTGHTEYFTKKLNSDSMMMMVNDNLRIGLVTNHLPIRNVADAVTKDLVIKKIQIFNHSLQKDFGIERPSIAVFGLNPHAGDEGLIGNEEEKIIRPAIVETKKGGILVNGPFPADGFMGSGNFSKYDGILAMYHDQGLVAFKSLSFGAGVNYTAGLPVVRTSPDHGTAFDIAGQNIAHPDSFRKALFLATDIYRNRRDYDEMRANPLVRREKAYMGEEDEILTEENEQESKS